MPERLKQLSQWLGRQTSVAGIDAQSLEPASGDASFRRYFRVWSGQNSYIVMDAPPEQEDCRPFVQVAQMLDVAGVNVPRIFCADLEQGFLLLGDLGSETYLQRLQNGGDPDTLYQPAISALVSMQSGCRSSVERLPSYDCALLMQEMDLFRDWLLEVNLEIRLSPQETEKLQDCFEYLCAAALGQQTVFVHRDYHSRNLMWCDQPPGVLDFQDAVRGPLAYDLVSLLKDCYLRWPRQQVLVWIEDYRRQAADQGIALPRANDFLLQFDLMGVQRHLKASGIFARLWHRDGKASYLGDIPRTLNHISEVETTAPQLVFLQSLIRERVLPALAATVS
ncbi:MAG: phosphotransferase [Gammaproteobacteria bacterium]|nr:phosphotransferase [Gammaproteobacteria bacterium]